MSGGQGQEKTCRILSVLEDVNAQKKGMHKTLPIANPCLKVAFSKACLNKDIQDKSPIPPSPVITVEVLVSQYKSH